MFELFNRYTKQKGAYLVFFAVLLPFLCAFAALGFDLSRIFVTKSSMQNAADAAALAGAKRYADMNETLDNHPEADQFAEAYLQSNLYNMENMVIGGKEQEFEAKNKGNKTYYHVALKVNVPMIFARIKLIGIESVPTYVASTAEVPGAPVKIPTEEVTFGNLVNLAGYFDGSINNNNNDWNTGVRGATFDQNVIIYDPKGYEDSTRWSNDKKYFFTDTAKEANSHNLKINFIMNKLDPGVYYNEETLKSLFTLDKKDQWGNVLYKDIKWPLPEGVYYRELLKGNMTDYTKHANKVYSAVEDLFKANEKSPDMKNFGADYQHEIVNIDVSDNTLYYSITKPIINNQYPQVVEINLTQRDAFIPKDKNGKDQPVYIYVKEDFPSIKFNIKGDVTRPVIFYYNETPGYNTQFKMNNEGHKYRGVLYAPNTYGETFSFEHGAFTGSMTFKSIKFQTQDGVFKYEEFGIPYSNGDGSGGNDDPPNPGSSNRGDLRLISDKQYDLEWNNLGQ